MQCNHVRGSRTTLENHVSAFNIHFSSIFVHLQSNNVTYSSDKYFYLMHMF